MKTNDILLHLFMIIFSSLIAIVFKKISTSCTLDHFINNIDGDLYSCSGFLLGVFATILSITSLVVNLFTAS